MEFESEKARILNSGRPDSRDGIDKTDNLEATNYAEIAPEQRRYFANTTAKPIAVLILFLAVGPFAWQAARKDWFNLFGPDVSQPSSNSATERAAEATEQSPQDGPLPLEATNDPAFSWVLTNSNASLMALYGGERTGASFSLECLPVERQIEFTEFDVEKPSNMDGRIVAGASHGFDFSGLFMDDDTTTYFTFKVPSDNELWNEIAKGRADLTIAVDGSEAYDLPKSPVLSEFVSKCLAKI